MTRKPFFVNVPNGDVVENFPADAVVECDRKKLLQALVMEGSVHSFYEARRLTEEMLDVQRPYLPGEWFQN